LGVHEGKAKDIQGLILHDHKGLIIPAPSYFSYEPLPYSWNKILEDHDVKNPLTKFKQSTKEQGNSFNKEFLLSQGSQSMKKASHKKPPSNMKPMLDLQASKTQSNKKESVLSDLRESKLANKKGDKKFSQSVRKMPVKEEKNPRAVGGLEEGPIRSQRAVKEQDSMNEETNQGKSEENEETEVDSLMMELEEYNPGQYLEVCEQIQRYKVDEK
jgi:hypothetical protein